MYCIVLICLLSRPRNWTSGGEVLLRPTAYGELCPHSNLSIQRTLVAHGNCHDNALMKSFFGMLKSEFFYLNEFTSLEDLEAGLDDYICYYNHDRIKLKLNGQSPVDYRMRTALN